MNIIAINQPVLWPLAAQQSLLIDKAAWTPVIDQLAPSPAD